MCPQWLSTAAVLPHRPAWLPWPRPWPNDRGPAPLTGEAAARQQAQTACLAQLRLGCAVPPLDVLQFGHAQKEFAAATKIHAQLAQQDGLRTWAERARQVAPVAFVAGLSARMGHLGLLGSTGLAATLVAAASGRLTAILGHGQARADERAQRRALLEARQLRDVTQALLEPLASLRALLDADAQAAGPAPLAGDSVAVLAAEAERLGRHLDHLGQRRHVAERTLAGVAARYRREAEAAEQAAKAELRAPGRNAVWCCAGAVALSCLVGALHPFASLPGLVVSCLCLAAAGLVLLSSVRPALNYLDAMGTPRAGSAADRATVWRAAEQGALVLLAETQATPARPPEAEAALAAAADILRARPT